MGCQTSWPDPRHGDQLFKLPWAWYPSLHPSPNRRPKWFRHGAGSLLTPQMPAEADALISNPLALRISVRMRFRQAMGIPLPMDGLTGCTIER